MLKKMVFFVLVLAVIFTIAACNEEPQEVQEVLDLPKDGEEWITPINFSTLTESTGANESVYFSPDERNIAWIEMRAQLDWLLVINGRTPLEYGNISKVAYSPDSQHLAYGCRKGNRWYIIHDGKVLAKYGNIAGEELVWSPDNNRIAYDVWTNDRREYMVVDGERGSFYRYVTLPLFSPDSKRFAYLATNSNRGSYWVVDDQEYGPYKHVSLLKFSPDSMHFGFIAKDYKNIFAVIDGVAEEDYDWSPSFPSPLVFSPDGKRYMYTAIKDGKHILLVNGKEKGRPYENISSYKFSPDSKRIAFIAREANDGKNLFVLDGKESKRYENVYMNYSFSPDSKHCGFMAELPDETYVVVKDFVEGRAHKEIPWWIPLVFSPDSKHMAYSASEDGKHWFAVINGEVKKYHPGYMKGSIVFTPDSSDIGYLASDNGQWFAIVGGQESDRFDRAFIKEGLLKFEDITNIIFDSPTKYHLMGLKDNRPVIYEGNLKI